MTTTHNTIHLTHTPKRPLRHNYTIVVKGAFLSPDTLTADLLPPSTSFPSQAKQKSSPPSHLFPPSSPPISPQAYPRLMTDLRVAYPTINFIPAQDPHADSPHHPRKTQSQSRHAPHHTLADSSPPTQSQNNHWSILTSHRYCH